MPPDIENVCLLGQTGSGLDIGDAIDPSLTSANDLDVHAGLRTSEDDEGSHAFACQ
jgi:hypothetical protein